MKMIDKRHLAIIRKREQTIEKVFKQKKHYLNDAETKEDAFREGINAAMQVLNLHLVSGFRLLKTGDITQTGDEFYEEREWKLVIYTDEIYDEERYKPYRRKTHYR